MASSNTWAWSLNIGEVIDEAIELSGGQPALGGDLATARRSLNLLLTEWANKSINLWTLEQHEVTLTSGTRTYTVSSNVSDLLYAHVNLSGTDVEIQRLGHFEWIDIARKTEDGRPSQYFVDRQKDAPTIYVWPTPDNNSYILKYWSIKQIQDVTRNMEQNADIPKRFLSPLTLGLAWKLAAKRQPVNPDDAKIQEMRIARLKAQYDEALDDAQEEDRVRASIIVVPYMRR
jgi:hypothetical protein